MNVIPTLNAAFWRPALRQVSWSQAVVSAAPAEAYLYWGSPTLWFCCDPRTDPSDRAQAARVTQPIPDITHTVRWRNNYRSNTSVLYIYQLFKCWDRNSLRLSHIKSLFPSHLNCVGQEETIALHQLLVCPPIRLHLSPLFHKLKKKHSTQNTTRLLVPVDTLLEKCFNICYAPF